MSPLLGGVCRKGGLITDITLHWLEKKETLIISLSGLLFDESFFDCVRGLFLFVPPPDPGVRESSFRKEKRQGKERNAQTS